MLRALALITMMIDHAGLALFPRVGAFRCVGRLAFPLYCFLLVQGYRHTKNRQAYINRLCVLALITEIPFDLLTFGRLVSPIEQNAIFSLLLSLAALYIADVYARHPLSSSMGILCVFAAAMLSRVSYGWLGAALCLLFYSAKRRGAQALGVLLLEGLYALSLHLSGVATSWVLVSLCGMFAALPIAFYNGRRGARAPLLTLLFYAAYPLHIIALLIVRAMRIIPPYIFG